MNTNKITKTGVLSALAIVLIILIRFPIIPGVTYLEYDAGDVPLLIISFLLNPLYALISVVIVSVIQGITISAQSGWVGIIMHIIASGTLVVVAGYIYKKFHSIKGAIMALLAGTIAMALIMIPSNLYFTVKYWGIPYEGVVAMLPTAILPFNLAKALINSAIVFALYKPLKRLFFKQQ